MVYEGSAEVLVLPPRQGYREGRQFGTYKHRADDGTERRVSAYCDEQLGFDAGTDEFNVGATVTGDTSGATAMILAVRVTSGTWVGNDAAGIIKLYDVVGTFENNEALTDDGSSPGAATEDGVLEENGRTPLRSISWPFLKGSRQELQLVEQILSYGLGNDIKMPLWLSRTALTANLANSVTVWCSTTSMEFESVDHILVVKDDYSLWEVGEIDSVGAAAIIVTSQITGPFTANEAWVLPLIKVVPQTRNRLQVYGRGGVKQHGVGRVVFEELR